MINALAGGVTGVALSIGLFVVALIAWFVVNRASVRASEQVRLLAALLEEQKQQNQLLRQLIAAQSGLEEEERQDAPEFIRLIPER